MQTRPRAAMTDVTILSLHLAARPELVSTARPKLSGIRKASVRNADVDQFGIMGDTIVDTEHHGGADQAVYMYGADDYAWWSEQLGRELAPGTFGENITVASLGAAWPDINVGDVYAFGDVELQVTSPRIPCDTFTAHMQETDWNRRFRDARRPGIYCRVLSGGALAVGDAGTRRAYTDPTHSVLESQDLFYDSVANRDDAFITRALAGPMHTKERAKLVGEMARRAARG